MTRRIPRDTDEHLLRSVENLFAFGPCRLCGATYLGDARDGHLDYHRELFEDYGPQRRALERAVVAQEEKLGWELILDTVDMPLTAQRLRRHSSLYGVESVKECAAAAGINLTGEREGPKLPPGLAKRRKRRIATPEVA